MRLHRRRGAGLRAAEPSAYGAGYERIRRHAVEPGVVHDRHGTAVVALRGLAGWLQAFAELPAPPPAVCASTSRETLAADVERPVIDILPAMLNGHVGRASA